ncbi:uncharacterized protein FTOL_13890 [Fusarium torulosum]|uniref:Uncharacterized protein n=1 Tax=Fusarium torulosum TaxID=33205 RepID=A0AAE8SQB4_9HYPO|nr:uncharacterized protein FTOL_13890 [Fusarium torulosum]
MRVFASNEESAEDRACPCPVGADLRRIDFGESTERWNWECREAIPVVKCI